MQGVEFRSLVQPSSRKWSQNVDLFWDLTIGPLSPKHNEEDQNQAFFLLHVLSTMRPAAVVSAGHIVFTTH
jgi:hypothetical protein